MIFYIYDGSTYYKFYNYTQLINYLSSFNRIDPAHFYFNSFLSGCGNTDADVYSYITWHGESITFPRKNRIYQEDFIPIFCERIKQNCQKWQYVRAIELERQDTEAHDVEWQKELIRAGYKRFRKYRHHPKSHKCGYNSKGIHLRDKRYAADPEHAALMRTPRNLRHYSRNSSGWKHSTKYRFQWEPKVSRMESKEWI